MRMFHRIVRGQGPPLEIVLYERRGCHLCDEAEQMLWRLAPRFPMRLQKVDITADRELLRRYDIRIPVITIGGSIELEAPIDRVALEQALKAARSRSARTS